MIELLKGFPENVVAVACSGHVTKGDYDSVLVPRVEVVLAKHKKARLYYQVEHDFAGIDPSAVWEDLKVGMEHLTQWERVAIVTDVGWIGTTVKVFSFLISGEVRVFPVAAEAKARDWLAGASS